MAEKFTPTKEQLTRVKEFWEAGWSAKMMANEMSVSRHCIYGMFKLLNLKGKKRIEVAWMPLKTDIVGKRYGKLLVLKPSRRIERGRTLYLCRCDCGTEKEIERVPLLQGKTQSCGALECSRPYIDLSGQKFGELTVLEIDRETVRSDRELSWSCQCSCGAIKTIGSRDLRNGNTKSCGCRMFDRIHTRKYEPIVSNAMSVFRGRYQDGGLTIEQFMELAVQDCYYCGAPPSCISNNYEDRKTMAAEVIDGYAFIWNGLDRVDSNLPHTIDNVVPCCKHCNTAKLDYSKDEFAEWSERLYHHFIASGKYRS